MAEKGGKGFSLNDTAAKTPASNGKESSWKSKRGQKKVHFVDEDSPEPAFNFSSKSDGGKSSLFGKGDASSKGGKGSKFANGGKPPAAKEVLQLKIDPELMKNAECLMDCEAEKILGGIQEQMIELSKDSDIKLPVAFDKGLQYAKSNTRYLNAHSVRQVLQTLKVHGVTDGEICVLANVCPETIDEVFALVPSLKPKWNILREPFKKILDDLNTLKKST